MLARGTKSFVAPGEHGFSFFQVKMFTGSVSVLLTSISFKILIFIYYKFYFIIFIIIQYTVYVVGTLAAI